MKIPHPIPYQGSKRGLAPYILRYFPLQVDTLFEPFAGSAAISLAAATHGLAQQYIISDLNDPLVQLWRDIINDPEKIVAQYTKIWTDQEGREREFYNWIRDSFNQTKRTDYFLYLLVRCVKAAVRYNVNGDFNQSPDHRRRGTRPSVLKKDIYAASRILKGKAELLTGDYKTILQRTSIQDLVYMDPPYQGVSQSQNTRYFEGLPIGDFVNALDNLNSRDISYIVSYDGRTGGKSFGTLLPSFLELEHIEIMAGRSSQATLLGREEPTYESLYISPALCRRLEKSKAYRVKQFDVAKQMEISF
ncbi:MAG: Dam family site-specific DNA-(adenine-N6)-methyltransferase [Roseiflexaceae bacterium]